VIGSIATIVAMTTNTFLTAHTVVLVGQTTQVVVDLSFRTALAVDVAAWIVLGLVIGWRQARMPVERLTGEGWFSKIRPWESGGRIYRRVVLIHRWKDLIPDAGTWFGGLSKRRLPSDEDGGMARFVAECQRAERTHLGQVLALPLFAVWNPSDLFWWNVGFALVGNLPCWLIARFNRARISSILMRKGV
jgi:glycosyl-4,4'-diaponeurosporenoate acyltransferase